MLPPLETRHDGDGIADQAESLSNTCGQRIDYETPTRESLPEHEADRLRAAYYEVESTLAIISEVQDGRTNEDGDITEPLSLIQIMTIQELSRQLERSLTVLEALSGDSEGAL